jgi:hypothetical protein
MGRRDYSEYVYIARAYMNADKPDFKAAFKLTLANERNAEPQVLLALEMLIMVTKSKCSLLSLS